MPLPGRSVARSGLPPSSSSSSSSSSAAQYTGSGSGSFPSSLDFFRARPLLLFSPFLSFFGEWGKTQKTVVSFFVNKTAPLFPLSLHKLFRFSPTDLLLLLFHTHTSAGRPWRASGTREKGVLEDGLFSLLLVLSPARPFDVPGSMEDGWMDEDLGCRIWMIRGLVSDHGIHGCNVQYTQDGSVGGSHFPLFRPPRPRSRKRRGATADYVRKGESRRRDWPTNMIKQLRKFNTVPQKATVFWRLFLVAWRISNVS